MESKHLQISQTLRLGNFMRFGRTFVKITAIKETELEGIDRKGHRHSCHISLVNPVSLTLRIVESYGFRFKYECDTYPEGKSYWLDLLITSGKPRHSIQVSVYRQQPSVGRLLYYTQPSSVEFYFLHELQNLYFALMRKELQPRSVEY